MTGRPATREWLIVTRWGISGEYLSVARTCMTARGGIAPMQLRPKRTAVAMLQRSPITEASPVFMFCRDPPASIVVAGVFTPIDGKLRLEGHGTTLRVSAHGFGVGLIAETGFRIQAVRAVWFGEYFEGETK